MIREDLPKLEVNPEKTFDFSNEEIDEIIEEFDSKIGESARINRVQEIDSIQETKKLGKFAFPGFKKKEIHYLNMEEKKQMVLNGEHIPIQVGETNFNEGPVKYYSRTLKKKMKL